MRSSSLPDARARRASDARPPPGRPWAVGGAVRPVDGSPDGPGPGARMGGSTVAVIKEPRHDQQRRPSPADRLPGHRQDRRSAALRSVAGRQAPGRGLGHRPPSRAGRRAGPQVRGRRLHQPGGGQAGRHPDPGGQAAGHGNADGGARPARRQRPAGHLGRGRHPDPLVRGPAAGRHAGGAGDAQHPRPGGRGDERHLRRLARGRGTCGGPSRSSSRSARRCGCPSPSRTPPPRSPAPAPPTSTTWSRR